MHQSALADLQIVLMVHSVHLQAKTFGLE